MNEATIDTLLDALVDAAQEWCPEHDPKCNAKHRARELEVRAAVSARLAASEERARRAEQERDGVYEAATGAAAMLGALMDRLGCEVATLTPSEMREARLVKVENRPHGGARLVLSDTTLESHLAETSAPPPAATETPEGASHE